MHVPFSATTGSLQDGSFGGTEWKQHGNNVRARILNKSAKNCKLVLLTVGCVFILLSAAQTVFWRPSISSVEIYKRLDGLVIQQSTANTALSNDSKKRQQELLEVLLKDLTHEDRHFCALWNRALGAMPKWSHFALLHDANYFHQRAMRAFRFLGPAAEFAVPELEQMLLNSRHADMAAEALGVVGLAGIAVLERGATNKSSRIREIAIGAIGEIGDKASSSVPLLLSLLDDNDARVRARVVIALGLISRQWDIVSPELLKRLVDPDPNVRAMSALALSSCTKPSVEVISALKEASADSIDSVSREARTALSILESRTISNTQRP